MTASDSTDAKIYADEFLEIVRDGVPLVSQLDLSIENFEAGRVRILMPYSDLLQRPGGTISGPALMALADVTLYGVVMSLIGREELAVTTDLSFHFLSKPKPKGVVAEGVVLKLGRRLAIGEVAIYAEGEQQPICKAVGSYAIPPSID